MAALSEEPRASMQIPLSGTGATSRTRSTSASKRPIRCSSRAGCSAISSAIWVPSMCPSFSCPRAAAPHSAKHYQEAEVRRTAGGMRCVGRELCAGVVEIELLISETDRHAPVLKDLAMHPERLVEPNGCIDVRDARDEMVQRQDR